MFGGICMRIIGTCPQEEHRPRKPQGKPCLCCKGNNLSRNWTRMLTAHAQTTCPDSETSRLRTCKDQAARCLDPCAVDHFTTPAKAADDLATLVQVGTVNSRLTSCHTHLRVTSPASTHRIPKTTVVLLVGPIYNLLAHEMHLTYISSTCMCKKKARKTTKQWMRMLPVSTLHRSSI